VSTPDVHPDCVPFAAFLGVWHGRGTGDYPTIDPFEYIEEVTVSHVGKPFFTYEQRTRDASSGLPLHMETGFIRPVGSDRVEVVLAHPSGVAEILEGPVRTGPKLTFDLWTTSVTITSTAKDVTELHRSGEVDGDVYRYSITMAAVGLPLTHHLEAQLHRVAG
jgi:hypothetical protein